MKKSIKKFLALIMICTMSFAFNSIAFAGTISDPISVTSARQTEHKINGSATDNGGVLTYTSKTTRSCNTIKADAEYYGSGTSYGKTVTVVVTRGNITVASGTFSLDGQLHTLSPIAGNKFPAATYTITVTPNFYDAYGVSTHFYY